jgi:hypothetical protein
MKARSLALAWWVLAVWVAFGGSAAGRAQAPALDTLLQRTSVYMERFVTELANVVAEEEYLQQFRLAAPRRRLKSDFLLVRYPGQERLFLTFRDVLEVDGRPVADQQERLTRLFLQPFDSALRRASEIQREGLRHSLERGGRLADPLQGASFLQGEYQQNFAFVLRGQDASLGPDVREVEFVQRTPAGIQATAIEGTAWIAEGTGRVLRTRLRAGRAPNVRLTTTTFGTDPKLRIDVPIEMRDEVPVSVSDEFTGIARYRNFRRFEVRAAEQIQEPAASPR